MPRTLLPPRPFIPAPNCASVEIFYSMNNVVAENVFHVKQGSPFSLSDLQALRGVVNTWDGATWYNARSSVVTVFRFRCKALDTQAAPMDDYYPPTPRPGGGGSYCLPGNVTFAYKAGTALSGRSYRGRWYQVGIPSDWLDSNHNRMGTTVANNAVGWLNTLKANLAAAGYTQVVLSYATNKAWRTTAVPTDIASWLIVDYNLDSQNRRLTNRGF